LPLEPTARMKPTPLFFIFHLLGEWREKTASRPLARLLRLPGGEVDAIFGDGITTTGHRVMAAVFDGDPDPLYQIILDPNAEQFVRSRMCEALAMVTLLGELDRDLAGRFLRNAFMDMQPQAESYAWVGWQSAIAMLGMSDLKSLVKKAFDRGFVDSHVLGFDHFEQDLRRQSNTLANLGVWRITSIRFSAPPSTSCRWYCFTERYSEDRERWRRQAEPNPILSLPYENPLKGVGRNAPCPCGSGKKFKKCCLQ
jgi:hypothetical protein